MSVGKKSLERVANVAATKDETVSAAEKTSEVKTKQPSVANKSTKKTACTKKKSSAVKKTDDATGASAAAPKKVSAKKKVLEKEMISIGDDMPIYLL